MNALLCVMLALAWQPAAKPPAAGTVLTLPFTLAGISGEEGRIFVPENRAKPASRIIPVHFFRIPGTNPSRRAPIFLLPGGPGGFYAVSALLPGLFRTDLDFLRATGRDIVIVNQRGNPLAPLTANMRWPMPSTPARSADDRRECSSGAAPGRDRGSGDVDRARDGSVRVRHPEHRR